MLIHDDDEEEFPAHGSHISQNVLFRPLPITISPNTSRGYTPLNRPSLWYRAVQAGISCTRPLMSIRIEIVLSASHASRSIRICPAMGTRREDLKRACLEYLSHLIEPAWCSGKIPNADIMATISVSWELPIYVITEDLKQVRPGGRGGTMKNTNPHYPRWDGLINLTEHPPTVVQGHVQTRSPGYALINLDSLMGWDLQGE